VKASSISQSSTTTSQRMPLESPNERLVETLHQREALFSQLLMSLDQVVIHSRLHSHFSPSLMMQYSP
jgi:hypothetical protein